MPFSEHSFITNPRITNPRRQCSNCFYLFFFLYYTFPVFIILFFLLHLLNYIYSTTDTFAQIVQLVWAVVSFPVLVAVLNAILPRLNHGRGHGGPIQCCGLGFMVRQCFYKLDFAIGKLIRMLQKKATYVVLVNWMATCCGGEKWWLDKKVTTLKKMKPVPMNHGIQRKKTRKKSYRTGFSSLLVLVGVLSVVGMMSVAVNGACTGSVSDFFLCFVFDFFVWIF